MKSKSQKPEDPSQPTFSLEVGWISRAFLGGVALIGLMVIAGWHFHSRLLVQIAPGTIPMQYNTALCFIVLGVSGVLIITRRTHPLLPALGGVCLIVMGGLVIYQYSSGIALGIDTAFFYPWDLTLLAYPGRMALTSAVSFVSSGVGLTILAFRRRALAVFALLHTLPLSFGLTSMIGYVAGITFVLPFSLGSQMAIHTAIGFTAYGSVMLGYAWNQAPRTTGGAPKWAPFVATLMLPTLFLGVGITAQQNSALSLAVPFFIGLLVAAFFALAAYKLMHARVAQKGLILISVPLVFMLIFVVFVTRMSRKSEQAQMSYLQSKEMLVETQTILTNLLDAEASVRGYVIAGDSAFLEPFRRASQQASDAIRRLHNLVKHDPVQEATAKDLGAKAEKRIASLQYIEKLLREGDRQGAIERVQSGEGLRLMNDFRQIREKLLNGQQKLDKDRQAAMENAWQRFNWLLVAGGSIAIFLAVMLTILFSSGISNRIVKLTQNAQALAAGDPLANLPMKGSDEIAHLDHVFRKMAKALTEAARKERAIFENALDIICSTDAEGRFLKMSPSSLKIWGYKPQEMIGRSFTEFLVSDDLEKSKKASQGLLTGSALTDFENRYRRKNGSIAHMIWSEWWSDADQVVFAMGRDITERKRTEVSLRESEERYRLLFEGNPHPIWVYDRKTLAFLAVNPAATEHYGYSREDFLSMTLKDIRPAEDVPALIENVSKVGSETTAPRTWRHLKKDGTIIDVEIASHALLFAGRDAEIVLANNVTDRQRAEKAIKELNTNLENRTIQLEETNKELEAFSYSVSHDLRAPLRAIDGFSRILLEDYAGKLDEDGNRVLEVVRKNAQNMGQLIDDLLAFSRLGRKAIKSSPIDMTNLAKSVFEELNASSDSEPRPHFTIASIPPAYGDPILLRQVFVNLLSNAKKYSRLKNEPAIEVGGSTENGNNVYYVKDNGAGFDMKYSSKLFGVFQRLHSPEEFEGTGVGLAIVQRIIHRHGGKIWANGRVNDGATFYFTLPGGTHRNEKSAENG